ncbi:MAG: hypothetical protein ACLUIQ_07580 [Dialister invisus]
MSLACGDQRGNREKRNGGRKEQRKKMGDETDPPLSAGIVTDEQTESVRGTNRSFRRSGRIAAMAVVMGQFAMKRRIEPK